MEKSGFFAINLNTTITWVWLLLEKKPNQNWIVLFAPPPGFNIHLKAHP